MMHSGKWLWTRLLLLISIGYVLSSEPICEDKLPKCPEWKKKSLCDENPKFKKEKFYVAMSKLCKKTCEMCGDDDLDLMDKDSRCKSYYAKGYCEQRPHQGFMLRRCRYSCRRTIRNGITSPGRGNYLGSESAEAIRQRQQQEQQRQLLLQQQQSRFQADFTNPLHWGQQYAQQYAQQYGYYNQQQQQQQQPNQQYAQQPNAQQYPQQQTGQYNVGQTQQNDAQPEQQPSLSTMPVQLQALTPSGKPVKKHKVEA